MTLALSALGRMTRNAHLWLPGYLAHQVRTRGTARPRHAWVTIADHFEPFWGRPDAAVAAGRVARWHEALPRILERHRDSVGRTPRYSFFYPQEEYEASLMESLADLVRHHHADVEVHIHHDGGGATEFVDRMGGFIETLSTRHGLLRRQEGKLRFGFIHGNWALDNSLPGGRWCGLNNELVLLRDLGCYADFTLPSAPSAAQAGLVNVIYRATDDPERPRSHATGIAVVPGTPEVGDLTIVPGPLGLHWRDRPIHKPRLDTGEVAASYRPSSERARLWLAVAPRIGDHAFIKLFTHGAPERNAEALLGGDLDLLFEGLGQQCAESGVALHYVSAWEMWCGIEHLRLGRDPLSLIQ